MAHAIRQAGERTEIVRPCFLGGSSAPMVEDESVRRGVGTDSVYSGVAAGKRSKAACGGP